MDHLQTISQGGSSFSMVIPLKRSREQDNVISVLIADFSEFVTEKPSVSES